MGLKGGGTPHGTVYKIPLVCVGGGCHSEAEVYIDGSPESNYGAKNFRLGECPGAPQFSVAHLRMCEITQKTNDVATRQPQ